MRPIQRPVIRLPGDPDTLLTRIEPGNPHSSMVFKLRWVGAWPTVTHPLRLCQLGSARLPAQPPTYMAFNR
jgi:hypothetical protein